MQPILNGRYALKSKPSGHGGMSEVFRASDLQDAEHRTVAVKFFQAAADIAGSDLRGIAAEAFIREREALNLKHPSIVELIDHGFDDASQRPYVVLEWLPTSLSHLIRSARSGKRPSQFAGFDSYYKEIGRPILQALSLAHTRGVVHRDVKPTNILFTAELEPKLADFSISKIKRSIGSKMTLAHFRSEPYTPPADPSDFSSRSRDTWGWAACAIESLSEATVCDYDTLIKALEDLDVLEPVHALLSKALAPTLADRFEHAAILLASLDEIQTEREASFDRRCLFVEFRLSAKNRERIASALGLRTNGDLAARLDQEFRDGFAMTPWLFNKEKQADQWALLGRSVRLQAVVDPETRSKLLVTNVFAVPEASLEAARQFAFQASVELRWTGPSPGKTKSAIDDLAAIEMAATEFIAGKEEEQRAEGKAAFLRQAESLIRLFRDVETLRKSQRLTFTERVTRGRHIEFVVKEDVNESLVGQPFQIIQATERDIRGTIVEIGPHRILLAVESGEIESVPRRGRLEYNGYPVESALRHQAEALNNVRFRRSLRSDLLDVLAEPALESPDAPMVPETWKETLDESQEAAAAAICGGSNVVLIEGPPGTGKTRVIAEAVIRFLEKHSGARVLLSSQTHVALDNALERIEALQTKAGHQWKLLRVGRRMDDRVGAAVQHLCLDQSLEQWRLEIESGSRRWLEAWAQAHDLSTALLEIGWRLKRLSVELKEIARLEDAASALGADDVAALGRKEIQSILGDPDAAGVAALKEARSQLKDQLALHKAMRDSLTREIEERSDIPTDVGAESAEAIDVRVAALVAGSPKAEQFLELLALQANWLRQFGTPEPEFHSALMTRADVVAGTCIGLAGIQGFQETEFDLAILDEASKATVMEALVPFSRARRIVLVGDERQLPPFEQSISPELMEKHELQGESLAPTLFGVMRERLPSEGILRLRRQHRMTSEIGTLVSEVFYEGALQNGDKEDDGLLAEVLGCSVMWISTGFDADHAEVASGRSFSNPREVDVVRGLLIQIAEACGRRRLRRSVALLSGYSAQRDDLRRMLASLRTAEWPLNIECSSVDAYQGREADVTIYSVTRSNSSGRQGFLADEKRLNVALSRGATGLVIVGDHRFVATGDQNTPLARVLNHIRRHDVGCRLSSAAHMGGVE